MGNEGNARDVPAITTTQSTTNSAMTINWASTGTATSLPAASPPPNQSNSWLAQRLTTSQADELMDLGKATGLKVKL